VDGGGDPFITQTRLSVSLVLKAVNVTSNKSLVSNRGCCKTFHYFPERCL